jgi:hypothetical protein
MEPTVHVLGIHFPGQKIVLTSGPGDALEKIDIPSPLEGCFGCLIDSSYEQLTYIDYHSRYSVDTRPASCDVDRDVCEPGIRQSKKEFRNLYPAFSSPTDA